MLKHSVERRFISIVLGVLILAIMPLFLLFFQLSESRTAAEAADRAEIVIDANAKALGKPLWDFDQDSVRQIVTAMAAGRGVVKVEVNDLQDMTHVATPESGDIRLATHLASPISYPTAYGMKTIGRIDMYFARQSLFDGNYHDTWAIIGIFAFAVLVIFATSLIGHRLMVIRPLGKLTAAIEATAQLGSRHKVDWVSDDEMGLLARKFNDMQDKLAAEESEIRLAHRRATDIYNRTPAMLYSIDGDDAITAVSDYWLLATGYQRKEVLGKRFVDFVDTEDQTAYEQRRQSSQFVTVRFRRADGNFLDALIMEAMIGEIGADGAVSLCVMTDVTELREAEQRNHRQAVTDHLTGLLNRQGFEHALAAKIASADQAGGSLACLFVDLDRFKWINDTLGHGVGDKVLQAVVTRMRSQLRLVDTVARLGGDEFAILLSAGRPEISGVEIADRLSRLLDNPFEIDGHVVSLTASIGVALYPDHAETGAELLQKADLAMYARKRNGKNGSHLFDPQLANAARDRAQMQADIETGLKEDWFEAYLQPILDLGTGRVAGFEALLRLVHPEQGVLAPAAIVQNAEETGAIVRIGDCIFDKAVAQLARLSRFEALKGTYVAVNISPLQFEPGLPEKMMATLLRYGVSPCSIVVEITEAVLMHHNPMTQQILAALGDAGYRLALDDFGTGYSSLSYLHKFPVDIVKIDQSFVRALTEDGEDAGRRSRMLVEGINAISHQMNCVVVAEGIETAEQRQILADMGVDAGQGYLFSRPMPGDDIIREFADGGIEPVRRSAW